MSCKYNNCKLCGYKSECEICKENAELKEKYLRATDEGTSWAHLKSLEKENAELKRDKEDLIFVRDQRAECMCEDKEQVTEAREIIEGLMRFCRCFAQHHTEDIRYKEAEEYLKKYEC